MQELNNNLKNQIRRRTTMMTLGESMPAGIIVLLFVVVFVVALVAGGLLWIWKDYLFKE